MQRAQPVPCQGHGSCWRFSPPAQSDLDPNANHQNKQTADTSGFLQELPEILGQRDKCCLEKRLFSLFP